MADAPQFRIDDIHVLSFRQERPPQPIKKGQEYAVGVRLDMKFESDASKVHLELHVSLHQTESPESPVLVELQTLISFAFKNGEVIFKEDDQGKAVLDEDLAMPLISIAYSTVRGILFAKLGDSGLSKLILPAIPLRELLGSPLTGRPDD